MKATYYKSLIFTVIEGVQCRGSLEEKTACQIHVTSIRLGRDANATETDRR